MGVRERYAHQPPLPSDVAQRMESLPDLLRRHPVRLAYLFGSLARGDPDAADVDLAVLPDEGFSWPLLYAELSEALGTDRLDLVDLRFAPPYLKAGILQSGRCLFAPSEAERETFERSARDIARDERIRIQIQARQARWRIAPLPLRTDFLWSALLELERIAEAMEAYRSLTARDLEGDLYRRWAAERGLIAGLNLIFQIADHILVNRFHLEAPTYEDLLRALRQHGVISDELYTLLRGAGGLRNALVHEYIRVDPERVAQALRDASDRFRRFTREIHAWMSEQAETG
jgi:uncharacterized protein YutE (UPF0331/DUF86 family)/predicted nucleotidyltransferase